MEPAWFVAGGRKVRRAHALLRDADGTAAAGAGCLTAYHLRMDDRVWRPIADIAEWVERREAAIIQAENAMFQAARERATSEDERRYWDRFIAVRMENLRRTPGGTS